ncbi:MAG TPA: histidine kinase dimerization/phosphoacceptor domain -containing protein [Puia sp.]|nr:histidine kinase dimerization/phosphoacceptor domain -containing protein [Puia sp.]
MRKILLAVVWLVLGELTAGQDSSAGEKEREAAAWMKRGGSIGWVYDSFPVIQYCYEQAMALYRELNEREKEIGALRDMAGMHAAEGRLDLGEKEALQVLENYQSIGFRNLHHTYLLLARINRYKGNFNKGLLYAMKAAKTMEETGDTAKAAAFYGELALIYQELEQTEKSIEWYRKTLEIVERNGQPPIVYYRTAGFLVQQLIAGKKEKEALALILQIAQKHSPHASIEKASLSQILGYCYEALREPKLAEKYYLDMIRLYGGRGPYDEIVCIAEYDIGKFYCTQHQYEKAGLYLSKALAAPSGTNILSRIKDIHLMLFQVDSAAGRYLPAMEHFRLHKALSDSIFNIARNRQIEELQIQYETAKKQEELNLLQNESRLERNRFNLTLGGTALLLIIVGLLYSRYRLKLRSNRKLQELVSEKDGLLDEKEWLLKEIHHRVKNNLHMVMSLLNSQSAYLENEQARVAIRDSQHRVQAMSLIHQKLYQSENVAVIGMPAYIRELVEYLRDSLGAGQRIRFELQIEPVELDVSQAIPLGLILNEAITNALKYAFPGKREGLITITLQRQSGDGYLLVIADNGGGLPPHFDSQRPGSLGMSLMKGLAEDLDGSFTVESNAGSDEKKDGINEGAVEAAPGTKIKIRFIYDQPLKQKLSIIQPGHTTETLPL